MNKSITLELPEQVEVELSQATLEDGVTQSQLVVTVLEDYLFVRRFRRLREKMLSQATQNYKDEEVFEMVS